MIQEDYRAAIDVGTTKVVTVIGRERPDGSVEIAGVGVSPCDGLSKGIIRDDAATTQAIKSKTTIDINTCSFINYNKQGRALLIANYFLDFKIFLARSPIKSKPFSYAGNE